MLINFTACMPFCVRLYFVQASSYFVHDFCLFYCTLAGVLIKLVLFCPISDFIGTFLFFPCTLALESAEYTIFLYSYNERTGKDGFFRTMTHSSWHATDQYASRSSTV